MFQNIYQSNIRQTQIRHRGQRDKRQRHKGRRYAVLPCRFLLLDEAAVMAKANYWFERFLSELAARRAQGGHYSRYIHDDFVRDQDLDLDALLSL